MQSVNKQRNTLIILGVALYAIMVIALVFAMYKIALLKESTIIIEQPEGVEPVDIHIDNSPTNIISIQYIPHMDQEKAQEQEVESTDEVVDDVQDVDSEPTSLAYESVKGMDGIEMQKTLQAKAKSIDEFLNK